MCQQVDVRTLVPLNPTPHDLCMFRFIIKFAFCSMMGKLHRFSGPWGFTLHNIHWHCKCPKP
jgi:hypothetical protein